MALGLLSQTTFAALPAAVQVVLDTTTLLDQTGDTDSIVSDPNNARAINVYVDVDDTASDDVSNSDETIVTLTTSIGTWSNGSTTINVQCATDAGLVTTSTPDDDDSGADTPRDVGVSEGVFNNTAGSDLAADAEAAPDADNEEGCFGVVETLIIPAGPAVGTYSITAQTSNGVVDIDNLVVTAAVGGTPTSLVHTSQSHDSIGFTASGNSPWVNGTVWMVRVTDANGNGVVGRQIQFTGSGGLVLVDADTANLDGDAHGTISETEVNTACTTTTTYGTTEIEITGTIGTTATNVGRAQVVVCGTSAAGNGERTLTATALGTSLAAATDNIMVSNEPAQADLAVNISGNTITARCFKGTVPCPDDASVNFQAVPTTGAVFSAGCVELHDGVADSTFAVSEPNAQVLVTLIDDDDGTCGGTVGETWASSTRILQPTATATATGTAPAGGSGAIISGSIPRTGGFGLIVAAAGTIMQIETNTGCPIATMALWATISGEFVVHVPGTTIGAVNAAFLAAFPSGNVPANTPFVGKCV
jgi:hypothetical protein